MKLTEKIGNYLDAHKNGYGETIPIKKSTLGRWICHARNLENDSGKNSDIDGIISEKQSETALLRKVLNELYNTHKISTGVYETYKTRFLSNER